MRRLENWEALHVELDSSMTCANAPAAERRQSEARIIAEVVLADEFVDNEGGDLIGTQETS